MKKNSLCVCVFASGSKTHFFKNRFPRSRHQKKCFQSEKRFFENIRLLRHHLTGGGAGRGKKNMYLWKDIEGRILKLFVV